MNSLASRCSLYGSVCSVTSPLSERAGSIEGDAAIDRYLTLNLTLAPTFTLYPALLLILTVILSLTMTLTHSGPEPKPDPNPSPKPELNPSPKSASLIQATPFGLDNVRPHLYTVLDVGNVDGGDV